MDNVCPLSGHGRYARTGLKGQALISKPKLSNKGSKKSKVIVVLLESAGYVHGMHLKFTASND